MPPAGSSHTSPRLIHFRWPVWSQHLREALHQHLRHGPTLHASDCHRWTDEHQNQLLLIPAVHQPCDQPHRTQLHVLLSLRQRLRHLLSYAGRRSLVLLLRLRNHHWQQHSALLTDQWRNRGHDWVQGSQPSLHCFGLQWLCQSLSGQILQLLAIYPKRAEDIGSIFLHWGFSGSPNGSIIFAQVLYIDLTLIEHGNRLIPPIDKRIGVAGSGGEREATEFPERQWSQAVVKFQHRELLLFGSL